MVYAPAAAAGTARRRTDSPVRAGPAGRCMVCRGVTAVIALGGRNGRRAGLHLDPAATLTGEPLLPS
ncbi:MAG: hypothetical protein HY700_10920 [Gemmatimonadetes bacterium]|nr:hypothetical protein [Gemmatimonadota bacterium]